MKNNENAAESGAAQTGPEKKRLLIVDDHVVYRLGLAALLESEGDVVVVGGVGTAPDALTFLRENACDGVIVDISLLGANGIELVKHIRAEHSSMPMLVVSMHDESVYALRALRCGALGYISKRAEPDKLLEALRKVLSGQVAVSDNFGNQLIYRVARGQEDGSSSPIDRLSDRELEVMELIGQGQSSQQIADSLHLSVKTVESHRLHIKEKLGCRSAAEMVRFAIDWHHEQEAGLASAAPAASAPAVEEEATA